MIPPKDGSALVFGNLKNKNKNAFTTFFWPSLDFATVQNFTHKKKHWS
jgi:hypothetical protein